MEKHWKRKIVICRVDKNGCWIWTANKSKRGYGLVTKDGTTKNVTRIILAAKLGRPLSPGLMALHSCDNPPCVNPEHLWEGSSLDNNRDMNAKGRGVYVIGERHGLSKLTRNDVHQIREMLAKGTSQRKIAARFNVRQGTISYIKSGETWGHLS